MNWQSTYLAKHLAQKCLGAVPGLYRLQEWAKSGTGRWDRFMNEDFLRSRARLKADQFERAGLTVPARAVEQGTGWHGLDLVFLHLAGCQSLVTYDTRPWLQGPLLARVFQNAGLVAEAATRWSAVDPVLARVRAAELERIDTQDLEELLGRIDASYHVGTSFERPELEEGSCDLFFSDSVLQRVRPDGLETLVRESRRFLAPTGRQHHVIDCKDFHSITDARVPELAYLRYAPRLWDAMTSTYLNYQNRWRKSDFVDLFGRFGMGSELFGVLRREENVRWLRERAHTLRLGRVEPLEEVAVTRFELCTLPRQAAVARALAG